MTSEYKNTDSDEKKDRKFFARFDAWLDKYPLDADEDARSLTNFFKRIFSSKKSKRIDTDKI